MRAKRIIIIFTLLIIAAVASGGCTKRINEDLREFVASQPHDEQLFGWWKRLKDVRGYICFDDKEFKYIDAHYGNDGTLVRLESWYWYTNNGILSLRRQATPLTGIIDSDFGYCLSEDLQTLYYIESSGEKQPIMIRCQEPPAKR